MLERVIMLNLSSKDEGTWFYFSPDNPDLGGICLRELTPDDLKRIEKLTTKRGKIKFDRLTRTRIDNPIVDEEKAAEERWDSCIVDWNNVAIDDEKLECTRENKIRAMKIIAFVKFIAESLDELVDANAVFEEARLKNSGSS